jgi:pimeloyl-ACP methyl ester carboxylesterase
MRGLSDRIRFARFILLAALVLFATSANAGTATRIQLVAEIPAASLAVVDASGEIAGEVDGIATDALVGSGPADIILGARLHLSVSGELGAVTWGHLTNQGDFASGLPAGSVDGEYAEPFPGAVLEQLYTPPVEFDTAGPNSALDRPITLAAQSVQSPTCLVVFSKQLDLVKPPLVLVHGIGSNPSAWTGFAAELAGNRGFRIYAVDHSGGSYLSGAPTFGGSGDIHDSYAFVRGGMPGSVGVSDALSEFRSGGASAHPGKKIVVAKVDIVASSYGGLLSRWYIEQAADYGHDVRKLITLGTPHRGTPLTNMAAAALNNPVIGAADSQFLSPVVSMAGTLQLIDDFGFIRWKDGGIPEAIVPALEVMTVGSEVLGKLNGATPFRDNVAYGSIVGTDSSIDFALIPILNGFYDLEPTVGLLTAQKSYFPWMRILDAGASESDSIVPTWSQALPARTTNVPFDHISYHDSLTVQNVVAIWLQDATLPKGDAHRPAFLAQAISNQASRANAYVGSQLIGNESTGGSLVEDAIVQVTFTGPTLLTSGGGVPELGSRGGLVTATMTGMARVASGGLQAEILTLVEDDVFDTTLDLVSSIFDPGATPVGQLFSFSMEASIGRAQDSSILGPDGSLANFIGGEVWSVGYEITGQPDFDQSPWTNIDFPSFSLPPTFVPGESSPFVVGPGPGSPFTVEGGVHATVSGGGSQSVRAVLYEDNFFTDTVLEDRTFSVGMPAGTFPGALMPYSEPGYFLFKNASGVVEGADNSSLETTAAVYQFLIQPSAPDPSSANTTVNVAP